MGTVSLVFFIIIFYNKITRIIAAAVVVVSAIIVFFTLERWERQAEHFYDVTLMIRGYLHYRPELGTTILWAISLLFGLVVAVFMLYRFSFYMLALNGVTIFLLTWGPGFTRDATSFLIFLVCFCLLLIRKTNKGISAVYVAAPICIALVMFIQSSVPMEANLFQRRTLQELFEGPLAAVGDLIYIMTNPMYFSFQSTGFSGQGGRLGGPVTPNNRNVMTVRAPGRTYLAGATHNTYTGYAWISTLEPGQLYTQGMNPGQFEMLETATALMRNINIFTDNSVMPMSLMWSIFPIEDHRHMSTENFPALGISGLSAVTVERDGVTMHIGVSARVENSPVLVDPTSNRLEHFEMTDTLLTISQSPHYMHSFLPMSNVTVAIGTNRTGTVFSPPNARNLAFHHASTDYLPALIFDPSGNIRAPGFMSRGSQYSHSFLNVDRRLSFVEDMISQSFQGRHNNIEEFIIFMPVIDPYDEAIHGFNEIYANHNPDNYLCNLTYATIIYYFMNIDAHVPNREYRVRVPKELLGIPQYDITVTAQEISDLFDMFAFMGPNRELQYVESHAMLMAKLDSFSRDVLSRYAESVREHFMYVPEIVPQRVHDRVEYIIDGLETDYERIMAIRDYLIEFPYTLSPQPVPQGVCFVDHFLFEGREGYCTYYASAMAIMSRIAGVPSRYVEGFLLPPAPPDADDDVAIFVVTNMMAHAWVEVYLEGFGWLIVEATAPYAFFMDHALTIPQGNIQQHWFDDDWWLEQEHYEWMQAQLQQGFPGTSGGPFTPGDGQGYISTDYTTGGRVTLALVRMVLLVIFIIVAIVTMVFLLWQYIKEVTVARRLSRLPVNKRITTYFSGIISMASNMTSNKDPAETPYVYGQRVGMRFAFKNDSARLRDLVTLYYKARYGDRQLTDEESKVMEDSYFDMVNYMRLENKKSQFVYLRYILGIGAI